MKRIALVLALSLTGSVALADKPMPERKIAHARIVVSDVIDGASASIAGIDLGPAPLPGSSRVVHREDIERAVPQGLPAKTKIPAAVRIVRRTVTLSPTDLEATTRRAVAASGLGRGATYSGARPGAAVTVPDGYDAVTAEVPRPPRRAGKLSTVATLTFREGDAELAKVQVPIDIDLPKEAANADVTKGTKVVFVIARGSVEIRATATAGADGDVGDEIPVTISESGRVLRGKIITRNPATLSEAQ